MSSSPGKIFTVVVASGASTSSWSDTGSKTWKKVFVQVPTMSTGVAFRVQNSLDGGTTSYNLHHETIQSATVATPVYVVSAIVGDNGGVVPIPAGLNNIRFLGTAVVSGGVIFKIICSD